MFKIGEFSKLTQVSIRMLRYYDETGLLKPARTDPCTRYRLYAPEQIAELNKIIFLRDLGFNVSEIQASLAGWDDVSIASRLVEKRQEIESDIKNAQDKLDKIERAQLDIQRQKIAVHYNVSIKSVPGIHVLALRKIISDCYAEGALWQEMAAYIGHRHISFAGPSFTLFHDPDFKERQVDMEICATVDAPSEYVEGLVSRRLDPVPLMACTMVHGPFSNISGAYHAFANWLAEHNQYLMAGPTRQVVHRGPWNETDPKQYVSEIQIPLALR